MAGLYNQLDAALKKKYKDRTYHLDWQDHHLRIIIKELCRLLDKREKGSKK